MKNKNKVKKGITKIASEEKKHVETKEENTDDDVKKLKKISYVLNDGTLVDMVYNPLAIETRFAVFKNGKYSLEKEVKLNKVISFVPLPPNYGLIENDFLLLPSEAVDYKSNGELYKEVREFIDKYVELPESFLTLLTVYVMMTWLYDRFNSLAYLRVVGIFGTGKTRMLEVAGHICYKAMLAGGSITTSALFRSLDQFRGTLIFDEADLSDMESREMLRILRQGHVGSFTVLKTEVKNDSFHSRSFKVYGPKIMASKEKTLDVALESRFITQFLPPLEKSSRPVELPKQQFNKDALELRNKLLMFRFKNFASLVADEKTIQEIKLPRLKQSGIAMTTVASLLGKKPLGDILSFLKEYEVELRLEQSDSLENDVLRCILDLLSDDDVRKYEKIRIGVDLTNAFNNSFYDDYSNRVTNTYKTKDGVFSSKAYRVSAKKMGVQVRKLGIKLERDGKGFYIPIYREYPKIRLLSKRYGLDSVCNVPEKIEDIPTASEKLEKDEIPVEEDG